MLVHPKNNILISFFTNDFLYNLSAFLSLTALFFLAFA